MRNSRNYDIFDKNTGVLAIILLIYRMPTLHYRFVILHRVPNISSQTSSLSKFYRVLMQNNTDSRAKGNPI